MGKGRLESFSDGVIAIIITIMVLELKVPHGEGFDALDTLLPSFLSYVLSFIYIGIYWNNHHHIFLAFNKVSGFVLWANLHFLFWLSLFPFATAWMGENHFTSNPTIFYGLILLMASAAYLMLEYAIMAAEGRHSTLRRAIGNDWKGRLSMGFYFIAVWIAIWLPWVSQAIYVAVALMWLIPDRRIEREVVNNKQK